MRIPADECDSDLVISDLLAALEAARAELTEERQRTQLAWEAEAAAVAALEAARADLALEKAKQERLFPILDEGFGIPLRLIAPFEAQAKRNHDQTFQGLASRGGLSAGEMLCVIHGLHWREHARWPKPREALTDWVRQATLEPTLVAVPKALIQKTLKAVIEGHARLHKDLPGANEKVALLECIEPLKEATE